MKCKDRVKRKEKRTLSWKRVPRKSIVLVCSYASVHAEQGLPELGEKNVVFHEWFMPQDGGAQQAKRNLPGSCRGIMMQCTYRAWRPASQDCTRFALLDVKATMKAAAFGDDEMAHLPSNGLRALATVGLLCRRRCRCMLSPPGGVLGKACGHVPCPPRAAASPSARTGPAVGGHAIANGYGQAAVPSHSHGAGKFPRCPLAASSAVHTLCKPAKVCYQFDK